MTARVARVVIGMGGCRFGVVRRAWDVSFPAEPEELAGLRRVIRSHLALWGLADTVRDAQLCATELVTNVMRHVGVGTPTRLAVSMSGSRLRLEVGDPEIRALPTPGPVTEGHERGRGLMLVEGVAERWGVVLRGDSKVTWCELATGLRSSVDHVEGPQVAKAEALLGLVGLASRTEGAPQGPLSVAQAEEAAIDVIADLLHWLRAHGCDPDSALDRARMHFEAELPEAV
ncbi:ATP-binding protein [Streptomyces cyaneofuscatus]|uniref:ATP-binding protein n=1 Tax=Streptomyces cyaneofuscatus TaxID=66883 RepID=UPI00332DC871